MIAAGEAPVEPRPHEHCVTCAHGRRGRSLGGNEICDRDSVAGFEMGDASGLGDVRKTPTCDDTLADGEDRSEPEPVLSKHLRDGSVVVDAPVEPVVCKGIDVGDLETVRSDPHVVDRRVCPGNRIRHPMHGTRRCSLLSPRRRSLPNE